MLENSSQSVIFAPRWTSTSWAAMQDLVEVERPLTSDQVKPYRAQARDRAMAGLLRGADIRAAQ